MGCEPVLISINTLIANNGHFITALSLMITKEYDALLDHTKST